MPLQPKSLSARLRQLEVAKARANALPRGAKLSFEPMRELLGLATRAALRDWCDSIEGFEASKAFVRGGNGIEWEFDPRKTVAFLLKHFKRKLSQQAKKAKAIKNAAGAANQDDDELSLVETRQAFELARAIKREKREDNDHCRKDHVEWLFSSAAEMVRNRVMAIATKCDPNGNWPPAYRKQLIEAQRETLFEIYEDHVELKEEFDVRLQQERSV